VRQETGTLRDPIGLSVRSGPVEQRIAAGYTELGIHESANRALCWGSQMSVLTRNNVHVGGAGIQPMMFSHGFGCDQNMWRLVTPAFSERFRIITFDHVGAGRSELSAFDPEKYGSLDGYAQDVIEICQALDLSKVIFVGHSVSAMIGALAAIRAPQLFDRLIMVGPSPRYIDDENYRGGFTAVQIEELLEFLDANHLGWSEAMAPVIMGNTDRPELSAELVNSFCRTDPKIAKHFARTTFTSDNRADLPLVPIPCLILQCSEDVIAPREVGEYVHAKLPDSRIVMMRAKGHCPNLSAPDETIEAIRSFV
jgi:sigma-B regulation protein RsbQ